MKTANKTTCRCPLASGQERVEVPESREDLKAARQIMYDSFVIEPMNHYLASFVVTLEKYFKKQTDGIKLLKIEFAFSAWKVEGILPAQKSIQGNTNSMQSRKGSFTGKFLVRSSMGDELRVIALDGFGGVIKHGRKIRWRQNKPKLEDLYKASLLSFSEKKTNA